MKIRWDNINASKQDNPMQTVCLPCSYLTTRLQARNFYELSDITS